MIFGVGAGGGGTCSVGTFKEGEGTGGCLLCPSFSTSAAGASNCSCLPGYFRESAASEVACPSGWAKEDIGDGACDVCLGEAESEDGGTTCSLVAPIAKARAAAAAVTAGVAVSLAATVTAGVAVSLAATDDLVTAGVAVSLAVSLAATVIAGATAVVAGGAAGGASSGGGGGAGGAIVLVGQVQMMSVTGRVGGADADPVTSAFSTEFGWANYDIRMPFIFGNAGGAEKHSADGGAEG
ncbi:hypothetical protein T484DRAFT_1769428 [Baffinella frigidus]|nr:hypothetical protein T484DRAFT_1769428 [Cryptophyta sp. CCMP2293]